MMISPGTSEAGEVVVDSLSNEVPKECLQQVLTLAADFPSEKLRTDLLKNGCENLQFVSCDPVHLCINYEKSHGGKKREGSKFLHKIMNKFNVLGDTKPHLGPFVKMNAKSPLPENVEMMRQNILKFNMPIKVAERRQAMLNSQQPYLEFIEFVSDIAALCKLYQNEVKVKTFQSSKTLATILWDATAPTKIRYYFNNLNRLWLIPKEQRLQMPSGSASNESLNHELNACFRNIPKLHRTTLKIDCACFHFLKLMAHNCAEYMPSDYIMSQQLVVNHNVSAFRFSKLEWQGVVEAENHFLKDRKEVALAVAKKRPAIAKARHPLKRHTFNKRRLVAIQS